MTEEEKISCQSMKIRGEKISDDPRVKSAFNMIQTIWNLSYKDIEMVGVFFGPNKAIERKDMRPPLRDYECQWLAIWFPWSWIQIRRVFPKDMADYPPPTDMFQ